MNAPVIKDLHEVKASYQTPYGLVKSNWTNGGGSFTWHITIPPNSQALVYIPAIAIDKVTENGQRVTATKAIKLIKMDAAKAIFKIGSGDYNFEVRN
ncbi:alpha-L-rhamnosidase C-terminal domain-containing protein [Mucilaginibacter sp. SP1R1]|uniref:alpha-L-rhamnosidase C-terminal domain-containing protein n=1 Tax=Mucilaginibacter sp. SP1R1 TaxID=2723091 RepID=UPI00210608EA|nr:alpha-L-rhamnosidase C-terminal domain-containing protein [Mucilaginibacter sp. SP1R1]